MTVKTLKELKEENANSESVQPEEAEVKQEVDEAEDETATDKEEAAEVDPEPVEEADEGDPEVESWMQSEKADSQDDTGFKPNAEAKKRRLQAKALKTELKEKDSELEELRQKVAALEGKRQAAPEPEALSPRPKIEDFDYDDNAYHVALDKWYDERTESKAKQLLSTQQEQQLQQRKLEEQRQQLEKSVSSHYERAQALIDGGKLTEEAYLKADRNVREAMDSAFGGKGSEVVTAMISTLNQLGEGSEKVMYMLGVNPEKLAKLQNLLLTDNSGLAASAYLGSLQTSITEPVKKRSAAARPARAVDGEGGAGGPEGTLFKKWKKAEPGTQERISLKREAKRKGIDTSKWV